MRTKWIVSLLVAGSVVCGCRDGDQGVRAKDAGDGAAIERDAEVDQHARGDAGDEADAGCVQDCGGKECGPDGCGGSCGACAPNFSCRTDVCVDGNTDHLAVFQGDFAALGDAVSVARQLSRFDVVVLSHARSDRFGDPWINGSCIDTGYAEMVPMLVELRRRRPAVRIFGYVAGTADNPDPGGCYPQPSPYLCPGGVCSDFVTWVQQWLDLEANPGVVIDGIFIDVFGPTFMSAATRDSQLAYLDVLGRPSLLNVMFGGDATDFALGSPYFGGNDSLMLEGFTIALGSWAGDLAEQSAATLDALGVPWMAIASEAWGTVVDCDWPNFDSAYRIFSAHNGTAFFYQGGDLGIATGALVYCAHSL